MDFFFSRRLVLLDRNVLYFLRRTQFVWDVYGFVGYVVKLVNMHDTS